MRIAPEGWPFIKTGFALDAALLVIWYAWPGWTVALPVIGLALTLWLFVF